MKPWIESFFSDTSAKLEAFHPELLDALTQVRSHGRADEWDAVLASASPTVRAADYTADTVKLGSPRDDFTAALNALLPWRKGPFQIGSTLIDTEWRSDWKWQRVKPHLHDLSNRTVLDIGCGNGYHLYRMIGDGASFALGVDPTMLFNYQFGLMQNIATENHCHLLPLRSEQLPPFACFDTVFSMGVLYHRRSPIDHLTELLSFLRPGGQLVLETLIIEGGETTMLIPADRYAKMANVWCIPSPAMLEVMVSKVGFVDVTTVDVTTTTTEEQRATEWMKFHSLADFLDPADASKTAEGYPAPVRAIITATKPA